MRNVLLAISKFGLSVGNSVTIQLVDRLGNIYVSPRGFSINQSFTLADSTLSVALEESENILQETHYKLILPSGAEFTFRVPFSEENTPHDMAALMQIGCVDDVLDRYTGVLCDEMLEKLDLYFLGKNPRFSATQRDVVKLYEYYADEVIDTQATIDVTEMIDIYLSQIKIGEDDVR